MGSQSIGGTIRKYFRQGKVLSILNIFGCPILSPLWLGITYGIEQDLATGGSQFERGGRKT